MEDTRISYNTLSAHKIVFMLNSVDCNSIHLLLYISIDAIWPKIPITTNY